MPFAAHQLVVADDDDLLRSSALPENILEHLLVEFPFAHTAPVRCIAKMHERVYAPRLEKPERFADIVERHRTVERLPIPLDHQMHVAQNTEDTIRLLALRLPAGGSRKKPAGERQEPERRQAAFCKLASRQIHAASLRATLPKNGQIDDASARLSTFSVTPRRKIMI